MVLVSIVDFVKQVLVVYAQNLVLEQSHIGSLVFDFLQRLFLLGVITDQVIVFTLLLLQLMVNLENFDFCVKIRGDLVLMTSKIDKTISFYNWAF